MLIPLCPAALLVIEGKDAIAFAHAQFTSDVHTLAPGRWQWSAWLDAQGRTRAVFALLAPAPGRLVAWQPLGDAQAMRDALQRFVFRSALRLEVLDGWSLHRRDGEAPAARQLQTDESGLGLAMPGSPSRTAWLAPTAGAYDPSALLEWRRADILARLPLLAPELGGEFVPQALGLEPIDAIRFDKGCYPGQEVAARLHFRGGNKRHLHLVRIEGAAPEAGAQVVGAEGAAVGRILYSAPESDRAESLALAVLAASGVAAGELKTVDGLKLTLCDSTDF
jgi:tRNA-modifying protein YgfZ